MLKNIKKRQSGFTIIEVLIVLAIAGLIMLIVFLAVPALQRGSRNRGRENDASLLATAINDCITNNNGLIANCSSVGTSKVNYLATNANQLTTPPTQSAGVGTTLKAEWQFGQNCAGPATAREFTVKFKTEGAQGDNNRCISS